MMERYSYLHDTEMLIAHKDPQLLLFMVTTAASLITSSERQRKLYIYAPKHFSPPPPSHSKQRQPSIKINGFPGGPRSFELAARFCYSNGRIPITPSNVAILHCAAIFLDMTEEFSACNLLQQTETFLDGLFYWTWADILEALKASGSVFTAADSSGLLSKLISSLLAKIAANADIVLSSSSSSSSPETPSAFQFSSSARTPDSIKRVSSSRASWWFDELTVLSPKIIASIVTAMGSIAANKFLLHYLKTALRRKGSSIAGLQRCQISRRRYGL